MKGMKAGKLGKGRRNSMGGGKAPAKAGQIQTSTPGRVLTTTGRR